MVPPINTGDDCPGISRPGSDIPFHVVSNPEFLKEGAAIDDFMKPDRVVIGSDNTDAAKQLEQLYAPSIAITTRSYIWMCAQQNSPSTPQMSCSPPVSAVDEFANLADQLGRYRAVRRGIGLVRIGYNFIYAGTGYGGSCFPKDVKALIHTAENVGYDAKITRSVEAVNAAQKRTLFDKLMAHFDGDITGHTFALWGLAFKPNTDDMREAPSETV